MLHLINSKIENRLDMDAQIRNMILWSLLLIIVGGCEKKPAEKKNYFKRDEFKQSSSFRLPQHMSFQELKEEKERSVKNGNESIAITFLGHMIKKCGDPIELEKLRLEFADMLYHLQRCGEAAIEYQLYAQLYPGSEHAAYADFQAIKALNCEVLSADRDQDRTQEVIDLAKKFARHAQQRAEYDKYLPEVEKIATACCHRLSESEILHFYFNINHGQFKAAQARLDWIKDHFSTCVTEPELLELEYRLATACGNEKHADELLQKLSKKFPQHKIVRYKERGYAALF